MQALVVRIDSWKVYQSESGQVCPSNSFSRRGFLEKSDLSATSVLFRSRTVGSALSLNLFRPQISLPGFRFQISCSQRKDSTCTISEQDSPSWNRVPELTQYEEAGKCMRRVRVDVNELAQRLQTAKNADEFEEILKEKDELPVRVYSDLIKVLGKNNGLDSAISLVDWLRRRKTRQEDVSSSSRVLPYIFIYNNLLGAAKEAEKYNVVEKVISDMSLAGIDPNVVTYNILMSSYIQKGRELEALDLLKEMGDKGLSPSPISYSTALFAHRRLEDAFGAVKLFLEIRDKCYEESEFPKLENFTTRICYQVMREWMTRRENLSTKVLKLLIEMDKAGIELGCAEYERLIWTCRHEEHYTVCKELYVRIRERNLGTISLSVCNHVIWVMGKAKKWWVALEIYEDLSDKGPKPNKMSHELLVSHFRILLGAARRRGIWKWAIRLLDKMEEKGLKPGCKEWNDVLISCSKASEISAAITIFKRMVRKGQKPNVVSYGALLSALEKGRLFDEAVQVWKHMVKVGVKPNLHAYTIMASIHCSRGEFDAVNHIIHEMTRCGVSPTAVTFNAVISACARNGMGTAGYQWFQEMKAKNISPNGVTYEMVIVGLANDGKPRMAHELYLRARNEGMVLSAKAYDAVVGSSRVHGVTVDHLTLGVRPPEKQQRKI
ncbi:unnamed protein product [Cuscuta campestris]|uniref:Uncharacterized protein n=1 Tax=Cuscuta campestris TaxID=132261 RepID=A0A484K4F9_9ASTE|nr:unnamed protein product [Cuscuta campestris]